MLDLCTGTADLAIASATASPGAAAVVGVDFAGRCSGSARKKLARRGLAPRVRLVQGDAMRIPWHPPRSTRRRSAFGIRNVERPETAFADVFRVLRPGGRFAILEFGVPRMLACARPISRTSPCAAEGRFARVWPRLGVHVPPASVGRSPSGAGDGVCSPPQDFHRSRPTLESGNRLSVQRHEARPSRPAGSCLTRQAASARGVIIE